MLINLDKQIKKVINKYRGKKKRKKYDLKKGRLVSSQ